jgi:TRAP-type uncharacterized transport system substrate-binding protein
MNDYLRAVAIVLAAAVASGCREPAQPRALVTVRVAPDAFMASFAKALERNVPDVEIRVAESKGMGPADAFQGGQLDLALMPASDAYFAYLDDIRHSVPVGNQLRAISALHTTPLLGVVRPESGIRRVAELDGRMTARILRPIAGYGSYGPNADAPVTMTPEQLRLRGIDRPDTNRLIELVLTAFAVEPTLLPNLQVLSPPDALSRMKAGSIDAIFGTAYYTGDVIRAAAEGGGRLISIDGPAIDRLRQQYAFIRPVVIAQNSYPRQTEAVHSIGVDMLIVCRAGLDQRLVYALTKQYVASLPELSRANPSLNLIDLELASASPIPLHDGAARYYRESELFR